MGRVATVRPSGVVQASDTLRTALMSVNQANAVTYAADAFSRLDNNAWVYVEWR